MKRCSRPLSRGLLSDEELKDSVRALGWDPEEVKRAAQFSAKLRGTEKPEKPADDGPPPMAPVDYQVGPEGVTRYQDSAGRRWHAPESDLFPEGAVVHDRGGPSTNDPDEFRRRLQLVEWPKSPPPAEFTVGRSGETNYQDPLGRSFSSPDIGEDEGTVMRDRGGTPKDYLDSQFDVVKPAPAIDSAAIASMMPGTTGEDAAQWRAGGPLPSFVPGDDPRYQAWEDEVTRRAMRRWAQPDEPQLADVNWKDETISDERLKDTVRAYSSAPPREQDRALSAMHPKSFRYKKEALEMGAPPGRIDGVMAQDLQKAPLSRTVVNERPGEPLTLNRDKAISLALAGVARLNERVDEALSKRSKK